MCKFYCTSEGPLTNLQCIHCKKYYCGACLHSESGKMKNQITCANCGKMPRIADRGIKSKWNANIVGASDLGAAQNKINDERTKIDSDNQTQTVSQIELTDKEKSAILLQLFEYYSLYTPRFPKDELGFTKLLSSLQTSSNEESEQKSQLQLTPQKSLPTQPQVQQNSDLPKIFRKLTDTKLYTGAHKERFDEKGQGKGLEGRDSISKVGSPAVPIGRSINN